MDKFPSIHHREVLAILVAARLWGHLWQNLRILVHCDNAAVVSSLNSGRVQDPTLASCCVSFGFLRRHSSFNY